MLDKSLGNILLENTPLTESQLEEGLLVQREKGIKLGEALVQLRFMKHDDILKAVSIQLGIPYLSKIEPENIASDAFAPVSINFAKRNELIPLSRSADRARK